jgi:prepilin-type N-terminal cleavage/methylation domain-containing protein
MSLRRGFTLIELLTTIAVLVVVFGLVISLANFVRNTSATELTTSLLRKMEEQLSAYSRRNDGQLPAAVRVDPLPGMMEEQVGRLARQNNEDLVKALSAQANLATTVFAELPSSVYDPATGTVRDAWGSPIVFMPAMHPAIGMALDDRPFFFSAGPDRRYLTREDNLYSYEGGTEK